MTLDEALLVMVHSGVTSYQFRAMMPHVFDSAGTGVGKCRICGSDTAHARHDRWSIETYRRNIRRRRVEKGKA